LDCRSWVDRVLMHEVCQTRQHLNCAAGRKIIAAGRSARQPERSACGRLMPWEPG